MPRRLEVGECLDGVRLVCFQQRDKLSVVRQDGWRLGCPQQSDKCPVSAKMPLGRSPIRCPQQRGQVPVGRQGSASPRLRLGFTSAVPLVYVKGRLGAKWCGLRLHNVVVFLIAQWPEVCGETPSVETAW